MNKTSPDHDEPPPLERGALSQKSPDAFRTISEVSVDLDVPQHVLRFWEGKFTQIRPLKRGGGRRYYRPDDIELLRGIQHLLYGDGYTIKGVQKLLREHGVKFVVAAGRRAVDEAAGRGKKSVVRPDHIGRIEPTFASVPPPPMVTARPEPSTFPAPPSPVQPTGPSQVELADFVSEPLDVQASPVPATAELPLDPADDFIGTGPQTESDLPPARRASLMTVLARLQDFRMEYDSRRKAAKRL